MALTRARKKPAAETAKPLQGQTMKELKQTIDSARSELRNLARQGAPPNITSRRGARKRTRPSLACRR